jgi:hypothetical protein
MEIYLKKKDFFGSLKITVDREEGLFLVEPRGIINPSLVQFDLEAAIAFGSEIKKPWIYIVNTKNVLFPNPINLFYLSRIKELPFRERYYIYAPRLVVRVLARLTGFLIKPDQIIKTESDFKEIFL